MNYDIAIIGAGVIGLATARQLIDHSSALNILMLEKEQRPAAHQSSHNSGVLHSGIYYEPGSQKAELCREGYHKMKSYCSKHDLPLDIIGKFIIAQNEEEEKQFDHLMANGRENGLEGLERVTERKMHREEADIRCRSGLWVPQTGITEFDQVAESIETSLREQDTEILYNRKVIGLLPENGKVEIKTENHRYMSSVVINCAGLQSDRIARMTHSPLPCRIIPFRGEYYRLSRPWNHRINHLIYPVPDPDLPFLGIHLTPQLDGTLTAGPNAVFAFAREGYWKSDFDLREFTSSLFYPGFLRLIARFGWQGLQELRRAYSSSAFLESVRQILPEVSDRHLFPASSGVRAQAVSRDGELIDDFLFLEDEGVVHVCNAPSPGATASLAIGRVIAEKALLQL